MQARIMREASAGSDGHPHGCGLPCKFAGRPQGCSKGVNCPRCHLCEWHGRGLNPYPKNKDGTPWVYKAPPEKKPEHQPYGLADATAAALTLGGRICELGVTDANADYVQLFGVVTTTTLDAEVLGKFAPGYDMSQCPEAMRRLQEHLKSEGFTAAPNSLELRKLVRQISEPEIDALRRTPVLPDLHASRIIDACLGQLRQVLPASSVVLGLYKSRARTCRADNASQLHKDDVLLTEGEVTKALFPLQAHADGHDGIFDRYRRFCAEARQRHPSLVLPPCPAAWSGEQSGLTREVISSVRRHNERLSDAGDELVFDNVNVWIPRDTKQIVLLPLACSSELQYPLGADDVERLKTSFAGRGQALRQGASLIFYGQSLLHQALIGQHFDCGSGSLEARFLLLTPRKHAHRGSLRDQVHTDREDFPSDSPVYNL